MLFIKKAILVPCSFVLLTILGVQSSAYAQTNSDLTVVVNDVTPTTISTGSFVTIQVTVSNLGNLASEESTLRYLLSSDSTITTGDLELATSVVNPISAGGGLGTSWFGQINEQPGTYWLGACVDADATDSDLDNNCSSGVEILIPDIDLVMLTVTLSAETFPTGTTISLSTAIDNRGTDTSDASTLRYKLSNNSSISNGDSDIVTVAVPPLAGQERWQDSSSGLIDPGAGTFWIGACVDVVAGESATANNCSTGVQVEVLSDALPDLIVSEVIANPNSWALGAFVDFFAEITNQGSASSNSTTVNFYLSTDSSISTGDAFLGTDNVSALNPGQFMDTGIFVNPTSTPGSYWFGACVVPDGLEFETGNNCSAGAPVTVGTNTNACANLPITCGGLVSGSLSPADCDDSPRGTGYLAKRHTFNGGTGDEVVIDASWTGDGYLYLEDPSGSVAAQNDDLGSDSTASRISHTLTAAGEWTIWTTTAETAQEMSFDLTLACTGAPEPDLRVETPDVSPTTLISAETLDISTTVHNDGGSTAAATTLRYLVSTDVTISMDDVELTTSDIASLGAGSFAMDSAAAPGPISPGSYWVGVCVDSVANETNTGNNCSAGVAITVSENTNLCNDVVISCGETLASEINISDCDDSPRGAGYFARSFSFSGNTGDTATFDADWAGDGYLYLDDPSGVTVAENDDSGDEFSSRIVRTFDTTGTWTVWTTSESAGDSFSFDLSVACEFNAFPDLTVSASEVAPAVVDFGEEISVSATALNQGQATASATNIHFIVSEDPELTLQDSVVRTTRVSALISGQSRQYNAAFPALFTDSSVWVGVCVEIVSGEQDTENNCSPAVEITVLRGEAIPFNAGLNDSWFNSLTNGQGFFINVFPVVGQIFLSWFTYEIERPDESTPAALREPGHRWLTVLGDFVGNQAVLDIYVAEGGVFNASPPVPQQHMDGQIVLEFFSCSAGLVTYEITSLGLQGEVPIERLAPDNIPLCESLLDPQAQSEEGGPVSRAEKVVSSTDAEGDFLINEGLNDAWYYPATDGQGYFINVFPLSQQMFLSWFTYDTERPDESITAQLGEPGHRWMTALGNYSGNQATLDIYIAEGGIFDDSPPVPVQHKDGEMTVEFSDCNTGLVTFNIPSIGQQGEVPIQRITLDNVPLCESLDGVEATQE